MILVKVFKAGGLKKLDWNGSSPFTIPYKSFNTFNAEKTINKISLKNKTQEQLNIDEIEDLRILTFMDSEKSHRELLIESVKLTNEALMDERQRTFTKALQYFLARKYVENEKEFKEVMKMINKNSGECGGIFDRIEAMAREEEKEKNDKKIEQIIREQKEKYEKGIEKAKKEEKEKFEKKLELAKIEMEKRGIDIKDIQIITQLMK